MTFVCVMLIPASTLAQAARGVSAIDGVVKDASGGVLPGVTVEAQSPVLIEKVRTTVTDVRGQYQLTDLRPGAYAVTFTLPGFSTVRREGLELSANFTATVNVELTVSGVQETITVSGQTPQVDVRNVTQQKVISQEVVSNIPMPIGDKALTTLTPAAVSPPSLQDVGGSKGEASTRMTIHGGRQLDNRLLVDGMRTNTLRIDGSARMYFLNPAAAQEIVIELGAGGSAEYSTGGVQVNLIPKDGGNRFDGSFYTTYTSHAFQGNNLTADLQARGLSEGQRVRKLYDVNGSFGGPILMDRLWFYTAHRRWGRTTRAAGIYRNANPESWLYTPDLSQPADLTDYHKTDNLRLAWQVAQKHKLTGSYDWQDTCQDNGASPLVGRAWEAANRQCYYKTYLWQSTWTYPATDKLLFEAGATLGKFENHSYPMAGLGSPVPDAISVLEQTTNFRYRANNSYPHEVNQSQVNQRFSMSYLTGSHQLKAGLFAMESPGNSVWQRIARNQSIDYTFSNGVPISLTQYRSPLNRIAKVRPELSLFLQDQWRIDRLTLNLGLRFEYLRAYVAPTDHPATRFLDAVSYGQVDCVPCWKDFNPRMGASYDVFGTGKTAVKASLGRYVAGATIDLATQNDPITTSVNQVNRSWTDTNRNFVPDCDLRSPDLNGECGPMSNQNFGNPNVTTRYDPEVLKGWQHRGYNWQLAAVIEHELRPGIAVNAGYFRTWYGNFLVTDNLEVTPQDFDPYCITAPSDSRLPGGGGNEICGLANINPSKFGRVNNLVTFASHYGEQSEIYNGVDFNFNARLPRGGLVAGGVNIGNSVSIGGFGSQTSIDRCFVVDSPQELYQCDNSVAYKPRFKMYGWYPLPWGLQTSANFQWLPGAPYTATYNATTAEILPSLGRNLAGGARTTPIQLISPFSEFDEQIIQLDVRFSRRFTMRGVNLEANLDVYNALNANPILELNGTFGSSWLVPQQILDARLFKFGLQLRF